MTLDIQKTKRPKEISRRGFVAGTAGLSFGIAFGAATGFSVFEAAGSGKKELNAAIWVNIAPDGTINVIAPSSEMGQGVFTSMPLLLAEELDADWDKVKITQAPHNPAYGNPLFHGFMVTGASRSTQGYWDVLRPAGAQMRRVLLDAVAEKWGVPRAELSTLPSMVIHAKSSRKISYGDVAAFAKMPEHMPKITDKDLKPKSQWRLIGKDVPRRDVPLKVRGQADFGIDAMVPGMLYASILRAPVQGNGPDKVDSAAALKIKGVVKVIPLPFGVAVLGTDIWATKKGKDVLKVTWKKGALADTYNSEAILGEYNAIAVDTKLKGVVAFNQGDSDAAFKGGARKLVSEFTTEHVHQATMEPMNATAWVQGDKVEVWTPTQSPSLVALVASKVAKTSPKKVKVHTMFLGGGFGRKVEQETTVDAVLLSKITKKPVKVIWSREDDVQNGKYRPATGQCLEAALDKTGKIVGWRHRVVAESIFQRVNPRALKSAKGVDEPVMDGHQLFYDIPNQHHDYVQQKKGVAVGFWRSVGPGYTKFAVESFVDEIAATVGKDPVEYRLSMLSEPRGRKVIEKAARMAGWGKKRAPGRSVGIAYAGYKPFWNTHIAEVVEISVDKDGEIRVHNVWVAVDPGVAVQPENIVAQMESGVIFGISHALKERITFENGVVQQSNYHDYPVLRMADVPNIEVAVMASGQDHPGGIGEIGLPPVAPAIANALFALNGAKLRRLPFLPERVKAAMKA